MVRGVLVTGVVGTAGSALVGLLARGGEGGISALLGGALAFVVILVGLVGMGLVMTGDPGPSMAGALVVYLGQLILLVGAILVISRQGWLDGAALAAAAIATTILLQVGQITGYVRARHVLYPDGGQA